MHSRSYRDLETLKIRIKEHSKNALELAEWLQEQEEVEWVNYPGTGVQQVPQTRQGISSGRPKRTGNFWSKRRI